MNKNKTIGELLNEAHRKLGKPDLPGHNIMELEHFSKITRLIIVFNVLFHSSPIGDKSERMRLFLTDTGY